MERGLSCAFAQDEIDSWSEETRKRYAASGASIASNESIASVS